MSPFRYVSSWISLGRCRASTIRPLTWIIAARPSHLKFFNSRFTASTENFSGSNLPPIHSFMSRWFRVLRVSYRFQEIGVAPDTAAVLGRASPGSFSAPGILDLGLWLNNSLKLDAVLPAISEVVLIDKPGVLAGLDDLAQQDAILVFHLHAEVQVVEIRFTVVFVVDDKLMHVAVLPAHDGLDDLMKIAQGAVWHLNPPPDGGLAVHERDLELIYLAGSFGGCGVRFWF